MSVEYEAGSLFDVTVAGLVDQYERYMKIKRSQRGNSGSPRHALEFNGILDSLRSLIAFYQMERKRDMSESRGAGCPNCGEQFNPTLPPLCPRCGMCLSRCGL